MLQLGMLNKKFKFLAIFILITDTALFEDIFLNSKTGLFFLFYSSVIVFLNNI